MTAVYEVDAIRRDTDGIGIGGRPQLRTGCRQYGKDLLSDRDIPRIEKRIKGLQKRPAVRTNWHRLSPESLSKFPIIVDPQIKNKKLREDKPA